MSEKEILERLRGQVVDLDIEGVEKTCKEALSAGISPMKALTDGLSRGMNIVGDKYQAGEYFLSELVMAGEVMKTGVKILEPHLKTAQRITKGRVVIGTVRGDLHDIGKNIVAMLMSVDFDVTDLGTDITPEQFVEVARDKKAEILAMSCLLTTTMPDLGNVIRELEKAGIRKNTRVIIGGAPITPSYAQQIGADAAGKDAVDGVNICRTWLAS